MTGPAAAAVKSTATEVSVGTNAPASRPGELVGVDDPEGANVIKEPLPTGDILKPKRVYNMKGLTKRRRKLSRHSKGQQKKSSTWQNAKAEIGDLSTTLQQVCASIAADQTHARRSKTNSNAARSLTKKSMKR